MPYAITVTGLAKQYEIGSLQRETTIREKLIRVMQHPFRNGGKKAETIWALRDVSFAIEPGEVVGIVGRNGAGKSTLLKIISKITYPTAGKVTAVGRIASLLEVGTGFHEELTGRENVYLNGSILGMTKREVDARLDAIVDFAGVAKFIDTPIKRYSSGMRLRLGFAVAAHLEPDVLIIDEVLAVGDIAFQKKCLNAMENLRSGGRTVLFVSHNLAAVENLCHRCIWIDNGEVRADGASRSVIEAYMSAMGGTDKSGAGLESLQNRRGGGEIRFSRIEFLSPDRQPKEVVRAGDPIVMRFHYHAHTPIPYPSFGFRMYTDLGTLVTDVSTWQHGIDIPLLDAGDGHIDLEIGCLNLLPAMYTLSLFISGAGGGAHLHDAIEQAVRLEVDIANIFGSGRSLDSRYGILFFPQKWDLSGARGFNQRAFTFRSEACQQ